MSAARRFAPTFAADVVPGPVSRKRGANGSYLVSKGATVIMPNGSTVVRTLMSFGERSTAIARNLKKGVPVRLDLRLDGGAVIAVGVSAAPVAKPAAVAEAMPAALLSDCLASAGFDEHAAY